MLMRSAKIIDVHRHDVVHGILLNAFTRGVFEVEGSQQPRSGIRKAT